MQRVGVHTVDTRDGAGANRFMVLSVAAERQMKRAKNDVPWYWTHTVGAREGADCCSPRWITSHYQSAESFYALHEMRRIGCQGSMAVWPFLDIPPLE
jgi:hypothetical protein